MLKRTPIYAALAVVGLCASASALADPPLPTLTELCGTTVVTDTEASCNGNSETLVEDCIIRVGGGALLDINDCPLDADDHNLGIYGGSGASLQMVGFNTSISGAARISFQFKGNDDVDCYHNVIDIDSYELNADGMAGGGAPGVLEMVVGGCGNIDIYSTGEDNADLTAGHTVRMTAEDGGIAVYSDNSNKPALAAGTRVNIFSPNGNVTISGTTIEAPFVQIRGLGYGDVLID